MDHVNEASAARSNSVDQLVERWWQDNFPGSAVARDTEAWNVAHRAKEVLKQLLARSQSELAPEIGDDDLNGST